MRAELPSVHFWPDLTVDRRFWAILLLSMLLHGLLLWQVHGPDKAPAVELPRLLATLRQAEPVPQPTYVAAPPPEAARSPKVRQAVARPVAPPMPSPWSRPAEPANAPVNAALTVERPAAAASANSAPAVAAAPTPVEAVAAPRSAPVAPASDWLAAYRAQLAAIFARRQEYPRLAAARGWEGEVRLRLRIARKGTLLDVALDRSSGFEILDRHALALPAALGNLPPLPEGFEAGEIQVVVPIHYTLKKTT